MVDVKLGGNTYPGVAAVQMNTAEDGTALFIHEDLITQGVTFIPSVSEDGVISWTNDGNLDNPPSVNIKGPKGDTGPAGPAGKDANSPVITALAVTKTLDTIVFEETLEEGSREIVLTLDSSGIPAGMTVDGVAIPFTMTGFDVTEDDGDS